MVKDAELIFHIFEFFIYLLNNFTSSLENHLSISLAYFLAVLSVLFRFLVFRLFVSLYSLGFSPVSEWRASNDFSPVL